MATVSHLFVNDADTTSSFALFIDRLQDLENYDFVYVLLTSEGFPLPRAVNILNHQLSYESALSLFLFVMAIVLSNVFARRVVGRLFNTRFQGIIFSSPTVVLVSLGLLSLLYHAVKTWAASPLVRSLTLEPMAHKLGLTNTEALGMIVYTHYALVFQMAGILLLIAMIGAIVLTLRKRDGVKKQSIREQVSRTKDNSLEVKKVPLREGVSI
ncbi:MAG: NADH-quinone oxidoreductase subunit J [Candidatus Nucleicultricaceae bacterium]